MTKPIYKMELDWLQEIAETYYERELTETEIRRLPYIFYDEGKFFWEVDCAFRDAIEMAMSDREEWKGWDESIKDIPTSKLFDWGN